MLEITEYAPYDKPSDHLSEREALEQYSRLRRESPDSFVVLKDLDCGHWKVTKYSTELERQQFLGEALADVIKSFWSVVNSWEHLKSR